MKNLLLVLSCLLCLISCSEEDDIATVSKHIGKVGISTSGQLHYYRVINYEPSALKNTITETLEMYEKVLWENYDGNTVSMEYDLIKSFDKTSDNVRLHFTKAVNFRSYHVHFTQYDESIGKDEAIGCTLFIQSDHIEESVEQISNELRNIGKQNYILFRKWITADMGSGDQYYHIHTTVIN